MATSRMFSMSSISGSDEVHERVCSLCSEEDKDVEAVELCMDCEQFLCRSCSVQHGRFKSLQKHKVVQKEQVPNLSLSVLIGSEEAGFECTVCTIYGQYTGASVYCTHCCKYLCSMCENNHNQFGLLRNHKVKTVKEIRTEVSKSNNEDCQYVAIVEKPIRQEKMSCTLCKRKIEDTQQLWKCIHCGFRNTCQKCYGRHHSSNEGHRLISFMEFKVIYQQYGKSIMSGSEEFMGPVCSKCCEKGLAKYPHMFCTECNIFVCTSCKEDHASHRTESEDVLEKAIADEIVQMEKIEHDCSICFDRNLRSSAAGYCLKCDAFICVGCTKVHIIYFGQESHHIRGLKEVNLRKEAFFQKSLYSAKEVIIDRCDYCIRKEKSTAAAWKCLDCRKSLCIPCLDFHEIANVEHNLKIVRYGEENKTKGDSEEDLQSPIRKTEDYYQESFPGRLDKLLQMTIDLGSSRTGYTSIAFSFLNERQNGNLDKIHVCLFGGTASPFNSYLSKSCLLFDAAEEFHYFGEEAMTQYTEVQSNGEADNWYFFDQYDKCLRDKTLTDQTKLLSANGKAMNAGKVFEAFTVYLTNYLLGYMPDVFLASDIHLVYLVANTISTTGQSMLKNAAAKAGIDADYVSFVSKATSIIKYIEMHSLPQEEIVGKLPDDFWKPGFRFLVADLGYDQAEISVYERLEDGTCRKADEHFGGCGFKKCVSECIEVFPLLFGQDVYQEFCKEEPTWLDDVTRDISFKIRDYCHPIYNKTMNLRIPGGLIDVYEKRTSKSIKEEIQKLSKLLKVTMIGEMLRFENSVLKTVVENCISKNTSLINTILTKHRIEGVIFFGTLLENKEIKDAMIENFNRAVLVPNKMAHSQAAAFYDFTKHMKNCPFTYGIDICGDFHDEIHARNHQLRMVSNNDICQHLFRRYFTKGEKVNTGQLRFWRYRSVFPYQGKILVNILQSDSKEPKYADEGGINELDVISVNLDSDVKYGEIEVRMMFRESGLLVEAFTVQKGTDDKKETLSKVYSKMFREHSLLRYLY